MVIFRFMWRDDIFSCSCISSWIVFENYRNPISQASFDGDADRIVYHFELNGKWTLLDGDKIACLLATYVMQQLSELPTKSDYEFGVV